jgi:hypothetical protein
VPTELLPGAIALRSVANQLGIVVGPAVGAVIFKFEPVAVYITAGALFLVGFVAILCVESVRATAPAMELTWKNLSAGIGFIVHTRMLLGAISLDLVAVLFGDSIALAPVFALTILHVGPIGVGLLRAAPAVGALLAGIVLARRPLRHRAGPTLLAVVATFGAMMIVFGLSKSLAALARRARGRRLRRHDQHEHPLHDGAPGDAPELQGRVSAVEWVFISASNELGAFESGRGGLADRNGGAVVAGGAVMIGVAASWGRLFPELAHMGRLEELEARAGVGSARGAPRSVDDLALRRAGRVGDFYYQRFGSPTVAAAEAALGELDGGTALLFPSGAGATTALVLSLLEPGRHDRARPRRVLRHRRRVRRARVVGSPRRRVRPDGPPPEDVQLVWLEAPTNPYLTMPDLAAAAAHPAPVVVDATVATPVHLRPWSTAPTSSCTARRSTSRATTTRCSARWSAATTPLPRSCGRSAAARHRRRTGSCLAHAARA